LEHALHDALDDGAKRIELCGGMGIAELVRARDLVAGRVPVRLLRYGFESLELIADYKRAFAAGDQRPAVFLYPATAGTPPVEHPRRSLLERQGCVARRVRVCLSAFRPYPLTSVL